MTENCFICGHESENVLQTHHIVPRRYGGSDDEENLVRLCASCHQAIERIYDDRFYERLGVEKPVSDISFESVERLADFQEQEIYYSPPENEFWRFDMMKEYRSSGERFYYFGKILTRTGKVTRGDYMRNRMEMRGEELEEQIEQNQITRAIVTGPLLKTLRRYKRHHQ